MTAKTVSDENTAINYVLHDKSKKVIHAMLPYFENTVILGDSLAESILDFRLLRKCNVVAKRGRTIDRIDDDMETAIHYNPRVLFMEYGKNDIQHFHGDVNTFIRIYRRKIQYARRMLPMTIIYVHSIIPMHQDVMLKFGGIDVIHAFNKALRLMCDEMEVTYIDNNQLMKWENATFEYDGIHPKYPFYPIWLHHMAIMADLIQKKNTITI